MLISRRQVSLGSISLLASQTLTSAARAQIIHGQNYKIRNVKSGRYLSLEGPNEGWDNNDTSVTINDDLQLPAEGSPQIWKIKTYVYQTYVIINNFSGKYLSIRGKSQDNDATVIQYEDQELNFQQWYIVARAGPVYLIENVNSGKFIGPHARSTDNGTYCIQFDNQSNDDQYQLWAFEPV